MSNNPLFALKRLGEAITESLFELPAEAARIIAKESGISDLVVRNINLTGDFQDFVSEIKDFFCDSFSASEGEGMLALSALSSQNVLEKIAARRLIGVRNTLLTGQAATANNKLRPKYFKLSEEGGRTVQVSKTVKITNFPFAARIIPKKFIIQQIEELLVIWANNECEIELEVEELVQLRNQNSDKYTRKFNILIFGRGTATASYLKVDGLFIASQIAQEEALELAIENSEEGLAHFNVSPNWTWLSVQDDWIGPDRIDKIETKGVIMWNWRIEAIADNYFYTETDTGLFETTGSSLV